jgi:hypothetical protein
MRFAAGLFAVAIVATAPSHDAFAGDVEFDPMAAIVRRLVDQASDSAEECVHGRLLANLYLGVRDRDKLINAAAAPCETILRGMLAQINPAFAGKQGIHRNRRDPRGHGTVTCDASAPGRRRSRSLLPQAV